MKILVTGANGFIGKNLVVRLRELPRFAVTEFVRGDAPEAFPDLLVQADAVVHLAGENRPADETAFAQVNTGLTVALCDALAAERAGRRAAAQWASAAFGVGFFGPGRARQPLWPKQIGGRAGGAKAVRRQRAPGRGLPLARGVWKVVQAQL